MKWIEYDYTCNKNKGIRFHKKVEYNEANLVIAQQEACYGEYTITEDEEVHAVTPLPVSLGGTGSSDMATARVNLGITPTNIGAIPKTGGAMTGVLTMKGIKLTSGVDYGVSFPSNPASGQLFFLDADVADEMGL